MQALPSIPVTLQTLTAPVLTIDAIGIRFTDEPTFRSKTVLEISKIFNGASSAEKVEILFFLRECSRSLYMLPAQLAPESGIVPILSVSAADPKHLRQLLHECCQNDLALPALEVSEASKFEDLFIVAQTLFSLEYRGPFFLVKNGALDADLKKCGVLNPLLKDHERVNELSTTEAIATLKKLQWYRGRILSFTNPWMLTGIAANPA